MRGTLAWIWLALVPGSLLVSCDKIREITGKVAGEAEDSAGIGDDPIAAPGGEAADEWNQLVDLNEQGYRFRRDLPFPDKASVRHEHSMEIASGRLFGRSVLGTGSVAVEGTTETVTNFERDGSRVTISVERDRFIKPIIEGEAEDTGEAEQAAQGENEMGESLEGVSATFLRRGDGWSLAGSPQDFRVMAWAKTLRQHLDDYLQGTAVVPNRQWFGAKRFLPGVSMELRGEEMAVVLGSGGKGRIKLRFDRAENVEGHPCAVFRWTGDYTIDNATDLSGEREKQEMSVSDGEVWCSLIHPLVLRMESEGVLTIERRTPDGELIMRLQGAVKERDSIRWEPQGE